MKIYFGNQKSLTHFLEMVDEWIICVVSLVALGCSLAGVVSPYAGIQYVSEWMLERGKMELVSESCVKGHYF